MCGITGAIITHRSLGREELQEQARRMGAAIVHRGPDSSGVWVDPDTGVLLAHQRLAILDLSPAGHQPMVSQSDRYVISYNGEVYNFAEIRRELGDEVTFRGTADTEVLLAAFDKWGIEAAVKRFVGMFAFALWDKKTRELHLVRDRLGIKPLYYGWTQGGFVFGSELKALRAFHGFNNRIDRKALASMFRFMGVPTPYSIYEGIYKLVPGTILTLPFDAKPAEHHPLPKEDGGSARHLPQPYWRANDVYERGQANPFSGTFDDAVEASLEVLQEAVRSRMVSDVPIGAFLSGGIDSSAVVALMCEQASQPIRTFTIGFESATYNEANHARAVADHLGTIHTEQILSAQDALNTVQRLPHLYCEPFFDYSQIPTLLLAETTRKHVTVALSGDGGDEVFCGYNRYLEAPRIWNRVHRIPRTLRKAGSAAINTVPIRWYERSFRTLSPILPKRLTARPAGITVGKVANVLSSSDLGDVYKRLVSCWGQPESLVLDTPECETIIDHPERWLSDAHPVRQMMHLDLVTYLTDDILVKVDRATMSPSLEARVPLLDHRMIELAATLPLDYLQHNGVSKRVLREVAYRHIPREILERPKQGFGMPIADWLKGPLKEWAGDLLHPDRLQADAYLNPDVVQKAWDEHQSGRCDHRLRLWGVLMFQAWLEAA